MNLDGVIKKPWGYEYRMWESPECSLWFLYMEQFKETSMHCHPNKTTGLVLLKGEAEFCFLAEDIYAEAPEKRMIRRGLFHRERALSTGGCYFLELETPNDKSDLIRLADSYGRAGQGYEDGTVTVNEANRITLREPEAGSVIQYIMEGCSFYVERTDSLSFLDNKNENDIVAFLRGGLGKQVDGKKMNATMPGDVGRVNIIRKVAEQMEFVEENTLILVVPS